jgi:hypothetical protein
VNWFRFYASQRHDLKVQRLPGELYKTWVNILSAACDLGGIDGTLPSVEELAYDLRMTESALE